MSPLWLSHTAAQAPPSPTALHHHHLHREDSGFCLPGPGGSWGPLDEDLACTVSGAAKGESQLLPGGGDKAAPSHSAHGSLPRLPRKNQLQSPPGGQEGP